MSPKKGGRKPPKGAWRGEHVEGAAEFQKVTGKPDLSNNGNRVLLSLPSHRLGRSGYWHQI
ncbi:hypothetical protein SORBI_3005G041700 [Sorghum bicolor]|uniref:Uncharacterized protein n=1 Tax=Sorghum bicolor TaxID=4558 RepID=A0A1B6PQ39_SORBI|nr:hypothetical protein SORBI_3005G041700 [Sorghum bicolor]